MRLLISIAQQIANWASKELVFALCQRRRSQKYRTTRRMLYEPDSSKNAAVNDGQVVFIDAARRNALLKDSSEKFMGKLRLGQLAK